MPPLGRGRRGRGALALLPVGDGDPAAQLLALRLLSALLATLTVLATWAAARAVWPADRFVPLVSAAFAAALPMYVFIGGAANNDNFVALAGALAALGLARGLARRFGVGEWLLVLGGLLLALAGKRTAVGLLPAVLLAVLLWLATLRGRSLLAARLAASPWTPVILVVCLFALDVVIYVGYLLPFYG